MRYFFLEQKTPLNFVVCGMLSSKNGFLHMKRQMEQNVFILVKKGFLFITSNGRSYELGPNQFIFLKAGELHFGTKPSEGSLEYYWCHIDNNFSKTSDKALENTYSYFIPETGTIENLKKIPLFFNQLLDQYMNDRQNQLLLDYSVSLLFLELSSGLKSDSSQKDIPPVLYNAMAWIKANYSRDFSNQELADFLNCTTANVSLLFKKHLNKSIIQYTNYIRIENAKNLLSYFDYSIKECACECGFEDEKYFMKVFKTQEGITPTEYKNTFYKKNIN